MAGVWALQLLLALLGLGSVLAQNENLTAREIWLKNKDPEFFAVIKKDVNIHECTSQDSSDPASIHDYTMTDISKTRNISLSDYSGDVVLVVVTATYCVYTDHYLGMNDLQTKFGDRGFKVLAFPCHQFKYQEPGTEEEILNGIKYVRPGNGFVPNFQMFKKIEVNGPREEPLFVYLKDNCPPITDTFMPDRGLEYTPIKRSDVQWVWETFLVNREGKVVARAPPAFPPDQWEARILQELGQGQGASTDAVGK